jgi:hypothetical protein
MVVFIEEHRREGKIMEATHFCTTGVGNEYQVAVLGRYGDVVSVEVVKAYQDTGNMPGAQFGVYEDELQEI